MRGYCIKDTVILDQTKERQNSFRKDSYLVFYTQHIFWETEDQESPY